MWPNYPRAEFVGTAFKFRFSREKLKGKFSFMMCWRVSRKTLVPYYSCCRFAENAKEKYQIACIARVSVKQEFAAFWLRKGWGTFRSEKNLRKRLLRRLSIKGRVRISLGWSASTDQSRSPGRGGTPYNGLYGEATPKRGTFFRLEVYKRVGISRAEV